MNRGDRVGKYGCDARQDEDDECDVEPAAGARFIAKDNIEKSLFAAGIVSMIASRR
jgi:hypothetical protein